MATASSLAGRGRYNAYDSIAASTTDSVLVAAAAGKRVRVISFVINQGDSTPSAVTFNTKPTGAGTAIYPALKFPANGGISSGDQASGWFQTLPGEGLSVTTGAGSTTAVAVTYELVPA